MKNFKCTDMTCDLSQQLMCLRKYFLICRGFFVLQYHSWPLGQIDSRADVLYLSLILFFLLPLLVLISSSTNTALHRLQNKQDRWQISKCLWTKDQCLKVSFLVGNTEDLHYFMCLTLSGHSTCYGFMISLGQIWKICLKNGVKLHKHTGHIHHHRFIKQSKSSVNNNKSYSWVTNESKTNNKCIKKAESSRSIDPCFKKTQREKLPHDTRSTQDLKAEKKEPWKIAETANEWREITKK